MIIVFVIFIYHQDYHQKPANPQPQVKKEGLPLCAVAEYDSPGLYFAETVWLFLPGLNLIVSELNALL